MTSEPVLVFYKSNQCRHCRDLTNIWEKVTSAMKTVYPKLRFFVLVAKDNSGNFDENTIPKDLIRYGKWFPMVLLVPGKIWDAAMANLGPKNPMEIKNGVQMINAVWDNGDIKYDQKYDIKKPEEFARWLKDALENEDFKKVQNETSSTRTTIQPLINGAIRPTNPTNPTSSNSTNSTSSTNSISSNNIASNRTVINERKIAMEAMLHGGDVCSMRIIARPH